MCVVGGKALKPDKMQTDTNDEPKAGALGTDRVLREKKHPMEKFLGDAESLLNCSAASYPLLIEAPERAAKHPGVLHRGCLAVGHI